MEIKGGIEMKLSVKERLTFASLYPQQGTLLEQLIVKDISEKVRIDTKEADKIGLKNQGNTLKWENKAAKEKEVEFTDAEVDFLANQITRLDRDRKISQNNLDLCIKIKDAKAKVKADKSKS